MDKHCPERLEAKLTPSHFCAAGRFWGFRGLLTLLVFVGVLISSQPHAASMPEAPARPVSSISVRYEGLLRGIGPGDWLVGEISVTVDQQTVLIEKRGKAEIGAWVILWGQQNEKDQIHAEVIKVDRPAGWAGPVVQISGVLRKQTSTWWVVEQQLIEIPQDMLVRGEPKIGALVWVVAVQQGDMLRGLTAEVLALNPESPPVEFEGTVQSISPDKWRVDDRDVSIDGNTNILGEPGVGKVAEVKASQLAGEHLLAQVIRIVNPKAEASLRAMVAGIAPAEDGTQRWEVIVFPNSLWSEPTLGTLRVNDNTVVDESRAIARYGAMGRGPWRRLRRRRLPGRRHPPGTTDARQSGR